MRTSNKATSLLLDDRLDTRVLQAIYSYAYLHLICVRLPTDQLISPLHTPYRPNEQERHTEL